MAAEVRSFPRPGPVSPACLVLRRFGNSGAELGGGGGVLCPRRDLLDQRLTPNPPLVREATWPASECQMISRSLFIKFKLFSSRPPKSTGGLLYFRPHTRGYKCLLRVE